MQKAPRNGKRQHKKKQANGRGGASGCNGNCMKNFTGTATESTTANPSSLGIRFPPFGCSPPVIISNYSLSQDVAGLPLWCSVLMSRSQLKCPNGAVEHCPQNCCYQRIPDHLYLPLQQERQGRRPFSQSCTCESSVPEYRHSWQLLIQQKGDCERGDEATLEPAMAVASPTFLLTDILLTAVTVAESLSP
ncbi:hypothetical protein SDJN02_21696, partial [Cucurbita argyrosperma subsp. argyrosperma]